MEMIISFSLTIAQIMLVAAIFGAYAIGMFWVGRLFERDKIRRR